MERKELNMAAPGHGSKWGKILWRNRGLILLTIPGFLVLFIFSYIPMYGILTAFQDYSLGSSMLLGADWVGFKWFQEFFASPFFWRVLRNTFTISFYSLIFTFPIPIILALLLNEIKEGKFRKCIQSVSYLPHFISTVVSVGILINMAGTGGVISKLVDALAGTHVQLLGSNEYFRLLYVSSEVWASFGWDSIIFVAALSAVDVQLYEAAIVDGAGRWKRLLHITVPTLVPTVVIQLILRMGNVLSIGPEKILLMYSSNTYETADIIATYVYRRGIVEQSYSYGVAVNLFNALVGFAFVWVTNFICKKIYEVSLW